MKVHFLDRKQAAENARRIADLISSGQLDKAKQDLHTLGIDAEDFIARHFGNYVSK
jgi:hypothetical protein